MYTTVVTFIIVESFFNNDIYYYPYRAFGDQNKIVYSTCFVTRRATIITLHMRGGYKNILPSMLTILPSGNIVNMSGNIFLYPPQGHPILYNYYQL